MEESKSTEETRQDATLAIQGKVMVVKTRVMLVVEKEIRLRIQHLLLGC